MDVDAPPIDALPVDSKEKESIIGRLPARDAVGQWRMRSVKFEKDDDRNFHVDFLWSSANIRAIQYKIKSVERLEAKLIAGNIIPAIVTTTALVTGLVCLEIYKVVQRKPYAAYRNSFVNLANSIFQSAEPMPPIKKKFLDATEFTEWDKIDVKRGDITLGAFLKFMKVRHKLSVDLVMYDQYTLYLDFMNRQKIAERLPKKLSELLVEVTGRPLGKDQTVFRLTVAGEDADGKEVQQVPAIFVWYKTKPKKKEESEGGEKKEKGKGKGEGKGKGKGEGKVATKEDKKKGEESQ